MFWNVGNGVAEMSRNVNLKCHGISVKMFENVIQYRAKCCQMLEIGLSEMLWNVNLKCYGMWSQMVKNVIEC
jgi:hypothetical protein